MVDESDLVGGFQRGRPDDDRVNDLSYARYFPEGFTPRDVQLEVVQKIIAAFKSKKFVLFEGGTGLGKTLIGVAVARYFEEGYYLCYEKYLQDQFFNDFGTSVEKREAGKFVMLKGRKAYECRYDDLSSPVEHALDPEERPLTCDQGVCVFSGKYSFEECKAEGICRYYVAKEAAGNHPFALLNYHAAYWNMHRSDWLPGRKLMIIDEAHNLEGVGRSLARVSFNNRYIDLPFPRFKSVDECLEYLHVNRWDEELDAVEAWAKADMDAKAQRWVFAQRSMYEQMKCWSKYEKEVTLLTVEERNGAQYVEMKPCDVSEFLHRSYYDYADHVLCMSATLLNKHHACKELGILEHECEWISKPSNFPVKNRPVFFCPSGSMSYNSKQLTMPTMAADVNAICQFFPDQRIVVHTHSHENADYLRERLPFEVTKRFYDRTTAFEKEKIVEAFLQSENGILVGPRYYEGLDLKYEIARVQIMMKVPYMNMKDDPVVEKKMNLPGGDQWYQYQTAKTICQLCGRIVRAPDDWGYTFVLDTAFATFRSRNIPQLFPAYLDEAIVWCLEGPISRVGMPKYDWKE